MTSFIKLNCREERANNSGDINKIDFIAYIKTENIICVEDRGQLTFPFECDQVICKTRYNTYEDAVMISRKRISIPEIYGALPIEEYTKDVKLIQDQPMCELLILLGAAEKIITVIHSAEEILEKMEAHVIDCEDYSK